MAYTSSTTILPHAGLYDYDGKQIELFHMQWFNCGYITGPRLMSLWNAWDWYKLSYGFTNIQAVIFKEFF